MTGRIGEFSLLLAMLAASIGFVAALGAARGGPAWLMRVARWAIALLAALVTVSVLALLRGLMNDHFALKYVFENSERGQLFQYKLSAFWAHQEGSLLLWAWMVAMLSLLAAFAWRKDQRPESQGITLAVLIAVCGFFCLLLTYAAKPFAPTPEEFGVVQDGLGLNPLLRTWAMAIHPPPVFLGYALSTVPFALLIGGLASGQMDNLWLARVRRWMLWTWLFLGIGIVLGAEWAYEELAFGGYWVWDAVENASLLPWLTATALLHLLAVQQHKGMFKKLNAALLGGTFLLCLVSTYITRSGISPMHSFGESPVSTFFLDSILVTLLFTCVMMIGAGRRWLRPLLFGVLVYVVLVAVGSMSPDMVKDSSFSFLADLSGWVRLAPVQEVHAAGLLVLAVAAFLLAGPVLRPRSRLDEPFSREGAFLAAALLLVAMMLTTLIGTLYPVLTGLFTRVREARGPEFYNIIVLPMALVLAGLMAFGPLLAYGRPPVKRRALALVIPVVLGHGGMIVAAVLFGIHNPWALACVMIVTLSVCVVIGDLVRSVAARVRAAGENAFQATVRLLASNHRRYGGQLAHIGILMIIAGVAGSSLFQIKVPAKREAPLLTLAKGQSVTVGRYTITLEEWSEEFRTVDDQPIKLHRLPGTDEEPAGALASDQRPGYIAKIASLKVSTPGEPDRIVQAEQRDHYDVTKQDVPDVQLMPYEETWLAPMPMGMPSSKVAICRNWLTQDLYVVFSGLVDEAKVAVPQPDGTQKPYVVLAGLGGDPNHPGQLSFEVTVNPLISWIWIGGVFIALGGIYSLLPAFRRTSLEGQQETVDGPEAPVVPPPLPGRPGPQPVEPSRAGGKRRNKR